MARMRGIVDRASIALEFFFIFAVGSAFIVLLAAIQTGKRERQMESSLLRAMSAKTSQLYRINVLEFTLMGSLIGLFSALFASLSAWFISDYFFDINYQFSPALWAYSLLSAGLVLTIAGTLVSRKVYNISPMTILRS
jgi:putative ABC transport system permease protein